MAEQSNSNLFLLMAVFSGFYAGGAYSWTSPLIPRLKSNDSTINPISRPITLLEDTWLSSGLVVGCFFGALIAAMFANRFGRKNTLAFFSILIFLPYASFIFIENIVWFIIGRVIMGLGVGSTLPLLPGYIGEITEDHNRGKAGSVFGIVFTTGHIINYCIGPFISMPVLNFLHIIPLLIFYVVFLPFVPESPYYFIYKNDEEGARRSLRKFRGRFDVEKDLTQVKMSIEESQRTHGNLKDLIKSNFVLKTIIIASGIVLCQPLTGFDAVQAYLQPIFEVNKDFISPELSVLFVGICPFVGNASAILFVEKLGRKTWLLLGAVSTTICLLLLAGYFYLHTSGYNVTAVAWLPILLLTLLILASNIGFASIPWIMIGELFTPEAKSIGMSIASSLNILGSLVMMGIFPYMSETLGMSGSFLVFGLITLFTIMFIFFVVPETRGKSFMEIQNLLKTKSSCGNCP